ncbi:hypothetical protein HYFRA_00007531 [Hymenoscyphus fraxineus]|uniref:Uncharacterized protein n=1 Tax=Hymenoscyphus fraxineus TaxID=746836 RepID=A0A9N9KTV0_9HELO|nr:hypothetical protein HYFRA_00007531 [Hymenoscyphus fraxineus]
MGDSGAFRYNRGPKLATSSFKVKGLSWRGEALKPTCVDYYFSPSITEPERGLHFWVISIAPTVLTQCFESPAVKVVRVI